MTPVTVHFALIGRAYPCEFFEHWAQVSRSARERRRTAHRDARRSIETISRALREEARAAH